MNNWKGCRGLDASVAVHVTNAMPPYLIADESKSPMPYSATNMASVSVNVSALACVFLMKPLLRLDIGTETNREHRASSCSWQEVI
jgi:hypothetical protein